jgi:hypothetical protein
MTQSGAVTSFPSIGRWSVTAMPANWIYVAGFGIKQMIAAYGQIAASVGVGEDTLEAEDGLPAYLEKQMKMIEGSLQDVKCAGPKPTSFPGADEAHLMFVRHTLESAGPMLHAQTYARVGLWVGIVTLTTLESQLGVVRADYDVFVRGLHIGPAGAGGAAGS